MKYLKKIHIIGGLWSGHKLLISNNVNLRPTMNRIKETVFEWLKHVVVGSYCLDCFAGSGGLGIEALSRGADKVLFLEKNYFNALQLKKNLFYLKTNKGTVINTNSLIWLKKNPGVTFDIIFIDPPFKRNMIDHTLFFLENFHHINLNNETWIYIESEKNITNIKIPKYFFLHKEKSTRRVTYRIYKNYLSV